MSRVLGPVFAIPTLSHNCRLPLTPRRDGFPPLGEPVFHPGRAPKFAARNGGRPGPFPIRFHRA